MEIKVINARRRKAKTPWTFYIGRPSALGNPYVIGKDGSRTDVIEKYRKLLGECLKSPEAHREMADAFKEVESAARKYDKLELVCWCAPRSCHGDVIREAIISRSQEGDNGHPNPEHILPKV